MTIIRRLLTRRLVVPLPAAVTVGFGRLAERTALFVGLEDEDGAVGWGEVFANWPPGGAVHRETLMRAVFAPLVEGSRLEAPVTWGEALQRATHRLRLQCDEPGPFDQCLAGLDLAAWHLLARREGRTLADRLADPPAVSAVRAAVPVYLSGVLPALADAALARWWPTGTRAVKLMIGADWRAALPVLERWRAQHGDRLALMVDASQAFDRVEALQAVRALRGFGLQWLEEPLPADAADDDWRAVADAAGDELPLAAGENLRGAAAFERAIDLGALRVLQPDVVKWGGFSGVLPIAREALRRGLRLCPHTLGGPVGWRASAHLLAAVGGDGLLETDVGGHLLAEAAGMAPPLALVHAGWVPLCDPAPPQAHEAQRPR